VAEGGLTVSVVAPAATRFSPFNNATVATITHAQGAEAAGSLNAVINWGDGTTSVGTVLRSGTTYIVQGSHTYTLGLVGQIGVTVSDEAGLTVQGSSPITVAPAPLPAGAPGTDLEQFLFTQMANAFGQPLTLFQLLGLEFSFLTLENSAVPFFQQMGLSQPTAVATVDALAKQEFSFLATLLANQGFSLNQAVNELQVALLMQSAALSQVTAQNSGSS
jgi:hypothetical protein